MNTYGTEQSLLENLTDSQLVKKFPAFYGTRKFITAFTRACHLPLSLVRTIQSMPPSHFLKIHPYIIPPIYAWLFQVVSFPRVSPRIPFTHLSSPPYVLNPSLSYSRFDHPNNIWWGVQITKLLTTINKIWKTTKKKIEISNERQKQIF